MPGLRRALALLLALLCTSAALAQVQDDFADGDFTADPPWTGDTDRFTVVPFGDDFALRSDGLAASDTIALATTSNVASGRWTFTFRWEANLTNANGTRVYLVADTPELTGEVQGYYVQLGTNNSDEVRLYRQDGPAPNRIELGASSEPVVVGDEGTVAIEVLRDDSGTWRVNVDGAPVITGVQDATYATSAALGVWLKHSTANGAAFFWDDVLADPDVGDLSPPVPLNVAVQDGGSTLLVQFDEALDATTVQPGDFTLDNGVGSPSTAAVVGQGDAVRLAFSAPIPAGDYVLSISDLADTVGNVIPPGTTIGFTFEADTTPPFLVSAEALDATTVTVTFSEPVAGLDPALYDIAPGIGAPGEVVAIPENPETEYFLLLDQPLQSGTPYTVTATGVADLAGNVQPETSASFFFGDFDTPDVRDIVVNEILFDPPEVSANEFVELFNRTDTQTFDLSELTLSDNASTPVPLTDQPTALGPGDYAVLVRDADAFQQRFPGVPFLEVAGFPALNNSGDTPTIRLGDTVIDAVPYETSWGGTDASLERRDPDGPSTSASNFATTTDPRGGTPGEQNTAFEVDTTPPAPIDAEVTANGQTITVFFDEPLDPATVLPGNFALDGGAPAVANAGYDADNAAAVLALAAPLAPGSYTVTITGVADERGNTTNGATVGVSFDPDVTPPALVSVSALDATSVAVVFTEAVDETSATNPANYAIDGGIGAPVSVAYAPEGNQARVVLTLGTPLEGPQTYTLTASNIADLAGNVRGTDSAPFFFGEGDVPEPRDIVVNEIMYDPPDVSGNEYVELFNRSNATFDLSDFTLSDLTSTVPVTADPVFLLPGEYAALVRNAAAFQQRFPDVPFIEVNNFPALNNSGDAVVLRHAPSGVRVDSVRFQPSWGGTNASLERRSPDGPSNVASNWATSTDPLGGTPAAPNSVPPDTTPPQPTDADISVDGLTLTISFDEPLAPAPSRPSAFTIIDGPAIPPPSTWATTTRPSCSTLANAPAPGVYIVTISGIADQLGNVTQDAETAFNFSPDLTPPALVQAAALDAMTVEARFSEAVDPASAGIAGNYAISDGIGAPASVAVAPAGDARRVVLTLATPLAAQQQYTLTASNIADLSGNVLGEGSAAFFFGEGDVPAPSDLIVNEIMYDPPDIASNEYVELFNRSDKTLDLSDFTLADQTNTVTITDAPRFVLPGAYTVLVNSPDAFAAAFPGVPFVEVTDFPSLNNSGDAVVIAYAVGETRIVTDSVRYQQRWGGTDAALERRSPDGPSNSAGNWGTSLDPRNGTPGEANSVPPDTTPPAPDDVDVSNDGLTLTVVFTEQLDPATVTPGAFVLDETITPAEVVYAESDDPLVTLTLAQPLASGNHTLVVTGVSDLQGITAEGESITFTFAPDRTPPALLGASAPTPTTVLVVFSEEVAAEAGDALNYTISDGIGVSSVTLAPEGDAERVLLTLGTAIEEGVIYTLTARGIPDLFGNVLTEATARFLLGGGAVPEPGELVVTEIMYDLPSERNAEEYIELYNASNQPFDLSALTLSDTGSPGPLVGAPTLLLPGEYLAVVADAAVFQARFPDAENVVQAGRFPSLNNTEDAVVIRSEGAVIDSVFYSSDWQRPELDDATGIALERLDLGGPSNSAANWTSSLDPSGGTPGRENSVFLAPGEAPPAPGLTVSPSPFNAEIGTQISYTLEADAALVRVRIFDAAGRLVTTLEDAALGGATQTGTLTWQGRGDDGQPLRIGIYIVFLEALDLNGGRTEAYKEVVVLARNL